MAIAIFGIMGAVTAGLALTITRTLFQHRRQHPSESHPRAGLLAASMVITWAATAWFASAAFLQATDALTA
ncbi:hypothetical protein GCM10025867_51520 (plasmid) [Frondihabitans sucicola]|uniref:Uncharacterized protein n=1 Tax=Frondihabitans sucicola TaxID=1268041 RepID=A0ABM8GV78_9MICO|nr:hypothetical protein [Frondihabitans sucicola]BDZ52344.1 hypothetical protein GCM10025867_45850 [Frondihabitans sucicola]BDZ52911.1 hypothetical protein GCM10025867_51520 [Frondihabitans sucicola]